jgi:hypothetical protein
VRRALAGHQLAAKLSTLSEIEESGDVANVTRVDLLKQHLTGAREAKAALGCFN